MKLSCLMKNLEIMRKMVRSGVHNDIFEKTFLAALCHIVRSRGRD